MNYYIVTVRYGTLRNLGDFHTKISDLGKGDAVIVRTVRGVEFGDVVNGPTQTDDEFKDGGVDEVLRRAEGEDSKKQKNIEKVIIPEQFKYCQQKVKELSIPMKLVGIEHLFGGKKIIIYYIAEKRIDFRKLVKDLASKFQARIEMKQIGVRDEARMLADYQHCGRELCCRTFLKNLEPVAMKMAKRQKATMDPAKISGRCGKLMCCLRYEDEVYEELRNKLPRKGNLVKTTKGDGEVLDVEILAQNVLIETGEGKRVSVSLEEIVGMQKRPSPSNANKKRKCATTCNEGCVTK